MSPLLIEGSKCAFLVLIKCDDGERLGRRGSLLVDSVGVHGGT